MDKKWVIKEKGDPVVVKQLAGSLGVSESLANLMAQRNITTSAEAEAFFNPSLDYLHDPFLMKDMNLAVDRISSAINKNERILVYGDYDVDGTTAVAMMFSFLRERYSNVDYYIPDRYKEGYGVSFKGLDYAFEHNCKVVVTLDCGIKAVKELMSLSVIITTRVMRFPKLSQYLIQNNLHAATRTKSCPVAGSDLNLCRLMQGCMLYLLVQYFITSIW
jgi:single-stranded-DNA-specific exonuclease